MSIRSTRYSTVNHCFLNNRDSRVKKFQDAFEDSTENLAAYRDHLNFSLHATQDLSADIPILTTSFFRDEDCFSYMIEHLRALVLPQPYLHQHVNDGPHNHTRSHKGAITFKSELKRNIRFIKHNVLTDAGFTNIDVVTCRNLLVYLDQQAQAQALKKFYFALIPEGRLFLGKAEDTRALESGFKTLEPSLKSFQKQEDARVDRPYPPKPP